MAASRFHENGSSLGGYNVELKEPLPKEFICHNFCKLLMKDPVQTSRGDRSCETCYREAKGNSNVCPIDGEPIEDDEIYPDRFARRQIGNLACCCYNKGSGV